MSVLDDLRNRGFIGKVTADRAMASEWFDDSERHLKAAIQIAAIDPSGAYVLAYDAARKSVAAALLISGHRVLSRPGAHRALAEYADWLSDRTGERALTRFDRLRRNRNRSEYGSRSFGKAEVAEAIDTARAIRAACAKHTGFDHGE